MQICLSPSPAAAGAAAAARANLGGAFKTSENAGAARPTAAVLENAFLTAGADFFAAAFLATAFLAGGFFAAARLAGPFFAATFVTAFLTGFLAGAFLTTVFRLLRVAIDSPQCGSREQWRPCWSTPINPWTRATYSTRRLSHVIESFATNQRAAASHRVEPTVNLRLSPNVTGRWVRQAGSGYPLKPFHDPGYQSRRPCRGSPTRTARCTGLPPL